MSTFVLTANKDIYRANGVHIYKGQEFIVNINVTGITTNNLFSSSLCQKNLYQQLSVVGGINLPPTDPVFRTRGYWNVNMIR